MTDAIKLDPEALADAQAQIIVSGHHPECYVALSVIDGGDVTHYPFDLVDQDRDTLIYGFRTEGEE